MFKYRLLTTIVLAPLVLALLYWGTTTQLSVLLYAILLGCGYEWRQFFAPSTRSERIIFLAALSIFCVVIHVYFYYALILALIAWGLIIIYLQQYPYLVSSWGRKPILKGWAFLLLPVFVESLLSLMQLPLGKPWLFYLLILVWAADIGAYLSGKLWGKHKLIPAVSPGKSYEGIIGGILCVLAVAYGASYYFQPIWLVRWLLTAALVYIISVVGDLFISMLKRRVNLKDTGHILPGHGGLLDRLDSLIAAAPFFYCALTAFILG